MKEENLFSKWLDNNLTENELKALYTNNAFNSYLSLSQMAKNHRPPAFNAPQSFARLLAKRQKTTFVPTLKKTIASVAAIAAIAVGLYFALFNNPQIEQLAMKGEEKSFLLPDTSQVLLNDGSTVTYKQKNWASHRKISLQGEAFFKVAKGQKFTVSTPLGKVDVLGTQFNVKNRGQLFSVSCFEGKVKVNFNNKEYTLAKGNTFTSIANHVTLSKTKATNPSWTAHKSYFTQVPLKYVLGELQRQYNINITATTLDKNAIFTGSFTHRDLETALRAVTLPFNATYTIKNGKVQLLK